MHLLKALVDPPATSLSTVRTAGATVGELCLLERLFCSDSDGDGDVDPDLANGNGDTSGGVPALGGRSGGLWGAGTRNRRFAALLTKAYAQSAGGWFSRERVPHRGGRERRHRG